ncbi:hypothetical protein [Kamptonema sp. UHCC 0994]|uniref:hypothetical protein n=1 Tax=Kamptonema sp. UHCC 0994 TaxID=3031329 RepID=UPI0023B8C934|nr:hypothetical protein [Kamptonema sp. UHCC 0994]MDF0553879.1 hypothetical protein [Kamptonema sp. UHCC 0994]
MAEEQEFSIGEIAQIITILATLRFDPPEILQGSSGGSGNNSGGSDPSTNKAQGSAALTKQGGLSMGGGVRVAGAGVNTGFSTAATSTINGQGYQGSAGLSVAGVSANAKLNIGAGGLSFSGGVQQAQVGQGLVGSKVGPKIVGPKIVGTGASDYTGGTVRVQQAPERSLSPTSGATIGGPTSSLGGGAYTSAPRIGSSTRRD